MKLIYQFRFLLVLLLVLALICGALTAISLAGGEGTLERTVRRVFHPVQTAFSSFGDWASGLGSQIQSKKASQAEIDRLKSELAEKKQALADLNAAVEQNAFLTEMLKLKKAHTDYEFVYTNVQSRRRGSDGTTLTLNRGTDWGVAVGMPVLTDIGLIGSVSRVGTDYCVVTCLTDKDFSVGVYTEPSDEIGLLSGDLALWEKGQALLTGLAYDAKSKKGDLVRTTGAGGAFPRGLDVGEITAIAENTGTGMLELKVTPFADPDTVSECMILTAFETKVE